MPESPERKRRQLREPPVLAGERCQHLRATQIGPRRQHTSGQFVGELRSAGFAFGEGLHRRGVTTIEVVVLQKTRN